MDDAYWEKCPYYAEDKCPQSSLINRAYLIPHLLGPSDIDEAKRLCKMCGLYLEERRKYTRLKKRFHVVVVSAKTDVRIHGEIVNVSGVGALLELQDWSNFTLNQQVDLEIYAHGMHAKEGDEVDVKVSGEIKRVDDRDKNVAVRFLEEIKPEHLLAL
jgi:hypothetical protein